MMLIVRADMNAALADRFHFQFLAKLAKIEDGIWQFAKFSTNAAWAIEHGFGYLLIS